MLTVGSNDIARSKAFYDGVGGALGLVKLMEFPTGVGYARPGGRPQLWIVLPIDKQPATVGNWSHHRSGSRDTRCSRRSIRGGHGSRRKRRGQARLRLHYHPNYYGAYIRDPDGNKVCVVCHKPA
jgi:catechol 2,3-dioxygenase-like lactoylglutathione lyase family enzyme